MFGNRVLRRIFGFKGDEVTGNVLLIKCYRGDQIKRNGMGWVRSWYGGEEKCIQVLMGRPPEGKRPLGMRKRAWKGNTKMYQSFFIHQLMQ